MVRVLGPVPSAAQQLCRLDRSVAQWRDLRSKVSLSHAQACAEITHQQHLVLANNLFALCGVGLGIERAHSFDGLHRPIYQQMGILPSAENNLVAAGRAL